MASNKRISTRTNPQTPKVQATSDPERILKQARAAQKKNPSVPTRKPPVPIYRKKPVEPSHSSEINTENLLLQLENSELVSNSELASSSDLIQREVTNSLSKEPEESFKGKSVESEEDFSGHPRSLIPLLYTVNLKAVQQIVILISLLLRVLLKSYLLEGNFNLHDFSLNFTKHPFLLYQLLQFIHLLRLNLYQKQIQYQPQWSFQHCLYLPSVKLTQ